KQQGRYVAALINARIEPSEGRTHFGREALRIRAAALLEAILSFRDLDERTPSHHFDTACRSVAAVPLPDIAPRPKPFTEGTRGMGAAALPQALWGFRRGRCGCGR